MSALPNLVYLLRPAVQLTTSVIGRGTADPTVMLIKNRWPSAETSNLLVPPIFVCESNRGLTLVTAKLVPLVFTSAAVSWLSDAT